FTRFRVWGLSVYSGPAAPRRSIDGRYRARAWRSSCSIASRSAATTPTSGLVSSAAWMLSSMVVACARSIRVSSATSAINPTAGRAIADREALLLLFIRLAPRLEAFLDHAREGPQRVIGPGRNAVNR